MPPIEDEIVGAAAEAGQAQEAAPSLRETLAAAMSEAAGDGDAVAAAAAPAAAPDPAAAQAAAEQRARDEQGRFTKPTAAAVTPKPNEPQTPQASAEPPAQATIGPPPSWSATAKAEWSKLAPHIQAEVHKREADIQNGKAQWDQKAERLNRLDTVLAPRSERFRLAGIDEAQAVNALFAAQDFLERDPLNGLAYLARQYGVDFRRFAQAMGQTQQPAQGQAQLPPQVMQLAQEVQSLKSELHQSRQQAEQSVRTEYQAQVDTFAADPAHIYFANVAEDMGIRIKAGKAATLAEAYEQATWASPEIRPLLLRQQAEGAQQAAKARAAQARHASGSVTGSPAPGSTPGAAGPAPTLREELQRAFDA